ncbi:mCG147805 [Mus musculus]|nr:mCG147805 [Mus musculus]
MQLVFILNKVCSNWMPYLSKTVYQKINHSWH